MKMMQKLWEWLGPTRCCLVRVAAFPFPLGDRIAGMIVHGSTEQQASTPKRDVDGAGHSRVIREGDGKEPCAARPLTMSENQLDWFSCCFLNYQMRQFSRSLAILGYRRAWMSLRKYSNGNKNGLVHSNFGAFTRFRRFGRKT